MKKDDLGLYIFIVILSYVIFRNKKGVMDFVNETIGSNGKLTRQYDALFLKYATKYKLDPKMLKAIALNESSLGKNKGYEPKGGTNGLFQIKLSTARDFIKDLLPHQLETDEKQVETAALYLSSLSRMFKGDEKKIVMSYNQGQGATLKGKTYAEGYYQKYLKHKELIG